MSHRHPTSLRALLLLLLAIGPLQAQTIFACVMMDTVMHDPCCCDEHSAAEDHGESDRDVVLDSSAEPCCKRSVQVTIDQDARQDTPIRKSAEVRSDVDPPQALVSSIDALFPPHPLLTPSLFNRLPAAGHSGSDTWLITQRLRI